MIKILRRFSTIKISIKQGNYEPIKIDLQTNNPFGNQLKKKQIPLEYECGFSCECGTCAIQFENLDEFQKICDEQPIQADEEYILETERKAPLTRLSCQLKVTETFNNLNIRI